MFICLEQGANDMHIVQTMPLPFHHLLVHFKIQNGFTVLVQFVEKKPLYGCLSVYLQN